MKVLALAAIVVALALLLVGCGSSAKSNGPNAAPQLPGGGQAPQIDQGAFEKLRSCLKKHGVTFPSGGAPQGQPGQGQRPSVDSKTQKAMQSCSQYLPSQSGGGFGG